MAGTFKLGTFKLGHGGSVLVPTFPGGAGRPFKEPLHKGAATTVAASGS